MNKLQFLALVILFLPSSILYASIDLTLKTGEVQYFDEDMMKLEIEKILIHEPSAFHGDIWFAMMNLSGTVYFAPSWSQNPAPYIKDIIFPPDLEFYSIPLLTEKLPETSFPLSGEGTFVFAFGIADHGTTNFRVIATANMVYQGKRQWEVIWSKDDGDMYTPRCIIEDRINGGYWIGMDYGFAPLVHYKNGEIKIYDYKKGLKTKNRTNCAQTGFAYDSAGNLWVSTWVGMKKYNPETDYFDEFLPPTYNENNTSLAVINSMISESPDVFWLGTCDGLCRFEPGTLTWTYYRSEDYGIESNYIWGVTLNHFGNIWFCLCSEDGYDESGVVKFDGVNFTSFSETGTFNSDNRYFWGIGEDFECGIWASSLIKDSGVFRYIDQKWVEYDENDGLPSVNLFFFYLDRFDNFWSGWDTWHTSYKGSLLQFKENRWFTVLPDIANYGLISVFGIYQDPDNNYLFFGDDYTALKWGK